MIQIIGGFIQQQDIRLLEKQLGQNDLGPLAAAHLGDGPVQPQTGQSQAVCHLLD